MRLAALLLILVLIASMSMLVSVGCDDLTTEVNNNTYFDSTLGQDCLRCHSDDDNAIKQPKGQWAESRHASPDLIEATVMLNTKSKSTNVCGPQCHTSEGFITFTEAGTTNQQLSPSVIDCFTCHMPHSGNYGTWQIDTLRGFEKPAILNGNFDYDMGKSNMCVVCHQAQRIPVIPNGSLQVRLDTLGVDGPHYSPQAHMLVGNGGFSFGSLTLLNSHTTAVTTKDGCLSCHFGTGVGYKFGEHTFKLEDDQTDEQYLGNCNVAGCHPAGGTITDFDRTTIQESIRRMSDSLAGLLIADNVLTGDDADSTEYYIDSTVSADVARVLFNYLFVKKDGSRGVHNAKYAAGILTESVKIWDSIPRGSFTVDVTQGCAPLTVTFTNTSTGAITAYKWDFGTDNRDSAATRNASFTFEHPGSYPVTLAIRNASGLDSARQIIIVDSLPSMTFTASDSSVAVGDTVTFTQTTERSTSFLWEFGDTRVDSVSLAPKITYPLAGDYTVRLTVKNICGSVTDTLTIVVGP
jgi:PKD repeat protein